MREPYVRPTATLRDNHRAFGSDSFGGVGFPAMDGSNLLINRFVRDEPKPQIEFNETALHLRRAEGFRPRKTTSALKPDVSLKSEFGSSQELKIARNTRTSRLATMTRTVQRTNPTNVASCAEISMVPCSCSAMIPAPVLSKCRLAGMRFPVKLVGIIGPLHDTPTDSAVRNPGDVRLVRIANRVGKGLEILRKYLRAEISNSIVVGTGTVAELKRWFGNPVLETPADSVRIATPGPVAGLPATHGIRSQRHPATPGSGQSDRPNPPA